MKEQEGHKCFETITPTEDYHKYVVIVEGAVTISTSPTIRWN